MGYDIGEQTVKVLRQGLPALPDELQPSQTVPVALWQGDRHGAVLFVRLWRNGNYDSDCAIAEREPDDSWREPDGWGGGGWIDDPLRRPEAGWEGDPVVWLGRHEVSTGGRVVRVAEGAASQRVAAISVEQAGAKWLVPIESACGAFLVGVESSEPALLQAVDEEGKTLPDASGQPSTTTL